MVRALDRYVFTEFWKIFVTTALGFPILVNIIDLTDNLDKYLGQNLSAGRIALSYLYWLPDSMFMVLPAAVLFATVFSIGALTRHSEITAAKASGISFYRFIAPIFVGAIIATILGLILGELAPLTNKKRLDTLWATTALHDTDANKRLEAVQLVAARHDLDMNELLRPIVVSSNTFIGPADQPTLPKLAFSSTRCTVFMVFNVKSLGIGPTLAPLRGPRSCRTVRVTNLETTNPSSYRQFGSKT